jgi:hypothetical protein
MYTGLKAGVNEKMAGAAARRAIQSGTTIDSNRSTSLRMNHTHHEFVRDLHCQFHSWNGW